MLEYLLSAAVHRVSHFVVRWKHRGIGNLPLRPVPTASVDCHLVSVEGRYLLQWGCRGLVYPERHDEDSADNTEADQYEQDVSGQPCVLLDVGAVVYRNGLDHYYRGVARGLVHITVHFEGDFERHLILG